MPPRTVLALAFVCATWATAAPARAEPETDPTALEAARVDFAEGQAHYRAKRWADALKSFERSYQMVASPNAELMIARCERELARAVDAAAAYANAEADAKKRVARGEGKYADTAQAAATEGAALRSTLGELRIHVQRPEGASLYVDHKPILMTGTGDARVFHEPGEATVTLTDDAGHEQRQTTTVNAGEVVVVNVVVMAAPAPTPIGPPPEKPAPVAEGGRPGWFLPATIAAGGVTLVAGGIGIGFGLSSRSTFESLYAKCGPSHCGPAERAQADAGERSQTIANVSYAIAAAGVVATALIVYFGLTSKSSPSSH